VELGEAGAGEGGGGGHFGSLAAGGEGGGVAGERRIAKGRMSSWFGGSVGGLGRGGKLWDVM
jgi:hypothetical protein